MCVFYYYLPGRVIYEYDIISYKLIGTLLNDELNLSSAFYMPIYYFKLV